MNEPLSGGTIRTACRSVELMLISRIDRRDALRVSSSPAQSFETIGETINPIDFAETVDLNSTKAIGNITHGDIQRFSGFKLNFSQNANRANFLKEIKRAPYFKVRNLLHLRKRPSD